MKNTERQDEKKEDRRKEGKIVGGNFSQRG